MTLPLGARLLTSDCKKMYPSIKTCYALLLITDFVHSNNSEFEYNANALCDALRLLMENMVFRFGDLQYKQITGTAMGVPPATDFANIFYGIHELIFLPEFKDNLAVYHRFVDDIFGIWIPHPDPVVNAKRWNFFKTFVNNFYGLKWIFVEPSGPVQKVDYMNLTITLANGKITTKVYEKPMALYRQKWQ